MGKEDYEFVILEWEVPCEYIRRVRGSIFV